MHELAFDVLLESTLEVHVCGAWWGFVAAAD